MIQNKMQKNIKFGCIQTTSCIDIALEKARGEVKLVVAWHRRGMLVKRATCESLEEGKNSHNL